VDEVLHTLRDAVILVAIVILVFLQDWKACSCRDRRPVSLVGTFAVMKLMGFSLNNLTLFGWSWRSHCRGRRHRRAGEH